ncbi:hypothetical protein U1Q18_003580, partial [Sarracenia purpurea var. burkii]
WRISVLGSSCLQRRRGDEPSQGPSLISGDRRLDQSETISMQPKFDKGGGTGRGSRADSGIGIDELQRYSNGKEARDARKAENRWGEAAGVAGVFGEGGVE